MSTYLPLRSLSDIEALERTPLAQRIVEWDFVRCLEAGCDRSPDKAALHFVADGDSAASATTWTYARLRTQATRIANALRAAGLRADDVVAIVSPTLPALYAALLGALTAARPFPVNWMLRAPALRALLVASRARAIIALGPAADFTVWQNVREAIAGLSDVHLFSLAVEGQEAVPGTDLLALASAHDGRALSFERPRAAPDDVAAYVHSGGTTGTPKIVRIAHRGLVYRLWATNEGLALEHDETVLGDTPLFHIGGLCGRGLVPIANGMTIVIPSLTGARNRHYLAHYWRFIERFRITRLSGVPTTLAVLGRNPPTTEDIGSLRSCFATGSTAIAPAVQQRIIDIAGVRPLMMYGLTENTSNVTIDPRDGPLRAGCSGLRTPYTQIRIVQVDDAGAIQGECDTGQTGMVLVRGPGVAPGYLDPAHDRGAFIGDGWFVTGDLGSLDADGYLRIVGRRRDLIIRGGHNIDPAQIEDALMQEPSVALAAAIGRPDAHAGELPIAFVELNAGACVTAQALLAAIAPRIADPVAVPKEIIIVDRIPLSAVGKPLKSQLAVDVAARVFADVLAPVTGDGMRFAVELRNGGPFVSVQTRDAGQRDAVTALLRSFTTPFAVEVAAATLADGSVETQP